MRSTLIRTTSMRSGLAGLCAALAVAACGASPEPLSLASATTSARSPAASPRGPAVDLAVVAGKNKIGLVRNGDVTQTVTLSPSENTWGQSAAVGPDGVAVLIGDQLTFFDAGGSATPPRRCDQCSGVAVLDGQIVTVRQDFSLLTFDRTLSLVSTRALEQPPEPGGTPSSALAPNPKVEGTLGNGVLVSHQIGGASRVGPGQVVLYSTGGKVDKVWDVSGSVWAAAPAADGQSIAMAVGGEGGRCLPHTGLLLLGPDAGSPSVLAPDGSRTSDDEAAFASSDLWWNGSELVEIGSRSKWGQRGTCAVEHVTRQTVSLQSPREEPGPAVEQFRHVGNTCDVLLAVPRGDEKHVVVSKGGTKRVLPDFTSILWTAPRTERCDPAVAWDN